MKMAETEDKLWVKVPSSSGVWKGEQIGDEVEGIYLKRISAPFRGRDNWKYCIESSHPAAVDGKLIVYGTSGLNSAMDKIPTGYMIKIIYQGEKASRDPMHKPFKIYEVYAMMAKSDHLYNEFNANEKCEKKEDNSSELKDHDDPTARNTINNFIEILKDQKQKITCEAVIKFAESDPDLKAEDFTRIKLELIRMHKEGKIKSAKDVKS